MGGKLSFDAVAQDQPPSRISLLKVTLTSAVWGSTSSVPASGMVLTTTGGTPSIVISSARGTVGKRQIVIASSSEANFIVGLPLNGENADFASWVLLKALPWL